MVKFALLSADFCLCGFTTRVNITIVEFEYIKTV